MNTYFRLGSRLELNWLRDRIIELPRDDRWQALARAALREDLLGIHRELTREVLEPRAPVQTATPRSTRGRLGAAGARACLLDDRRDPRVAHV